MHLQHTATLIAPDHRVGTATHCNRDCSRQETAREIALDHRDGVALLQCCSLFALDHRDGVALLQSLAPPWSCTVAVSCSSIVKFHYFGDSLLKVGRRLEWFLRDDSSVMIHLEWFLTLLHSLQHTQKRTPRQKARSLRIPRAATLTATHSVTYTAKQGAYSEESNVTCTSLASLPGVVRVCVWCSVCCSVCCGVRCSVYWNVRYSVRCSWRNHGCEPWKVHQGFAARAHSVPFARICNWLLKS